MSPLLLRLKARLISPWMCFFVLELFVLLLWWIAFYPSVMSPDSIDHWTQSQTLLLHDWQPYFYTLSVWFFRLFWNSPAMISLVQIISTAVLFSSIFHYLWIHLVKRYLVIIFFLLTLFSIPIGIYTVTLWKDVLFSIVLVGIAFFLLMKHHEQSSWNWKSILFLILGSVLIIQFRHNGIIYLVFLPLLVGIFFRKQMIAWLFPAILIPTVIFLQLILPDILHVQPVADWAKNTFIYHSTAGFYAKMPFTTLTPASRAMMEKVLPSDEIKAKYNPIVWDPLFWNPKLRKEVFYSKEFWQVLVHDFYSENLWRNLPTFLGDRTNLFVSAAIGYGMVNGTDIVTNDLGLVIAPLSIQLNRIFLMILTKVSSTPFLRGMIWCSWLGILILFILFIDSLERKKYSFVLFAFPLLIQLPLVFFVFPASDWRYMYFMYIAALITVPIYLLPTRKL